MKKFDNQTIDKVFAIVDEDRKKIRILDELREEKPIDFDRLYVTGFMFGVEAALTAIERGILRPPHYIPHRKN